MGMKSADNGLVPTRFMCLLAHLVIIICVFIRRQEFVKSCTEYPSPNSLEDQFIAALSLSITFLVVEILSFMFGITLFNSLQLTLSTFCHSTGAIAISCMIFYNICSVDYWAIFACCSCIPILVETLFICRVWCLKRPVS